MIGSKQFTIQAEDFIKGMSTSPDIADGGFSTETTGINILTKPGLLYAPAQATDASTNIVGTIIASCGGYNTLTEDRYFVDSSRNHYSFNGTTVTLQKTASGGTYTDGRVDMTGFATSIWVTTATHLTKWNGTSTLNESFQALTNTSSPHPVIVWENYLWVADGNLLHKMDSAEAWSGSVLTLETGTHIYALAIDPASGKLLLSTTDSLNASDTLKTINKILVYDGFSTKPNKAVIVEDLVTAMYPLSGIVYCMYGRNLGYFNGSGIDFLRTLKNVTYDNTSLVYKHRVTSINKNLYVADGSQVLCYGEILGKQPKVFYYAYTNKPSGTARQISCLTGLGGVAGASTEKLGIASNDSGTYKLYSWNNQSRSTMKNEIFYSNRYLFPRPIYIRGTRFVHDGPIPTSGGNIGGFSFVDEAGSSASFDIASVSLANTMYKDYDYPKSEAQTSLKVLIEFFASSTVFGVRQIIIFYDVAE